MKKFIIGLVFFLGILWFANELGEWNRRTCHTGMKQAIIQFEACQQLKNCTFTAEDLASYKEFKKRCKE